MDRIDALRTFCAAAEARQFRLAAKQLGRSPQVVTRMIGSLEAELGEPLFLRNTRNVRLSAFGERFLPEAQKLIEQADILFSRASNIRSQELVGTVRVTTPDFPIMHAVMADVLAGLRDLPGISIDWTATVTRLEIVGDKVDCGIRVGHPTDDGLIVRQLGRTWDRIVAAPPLLDSLHLPADFRDLQRGFPLCVIRNGRTGRTWRWYLRPDLQFHPDTPRLMVDSVAGQLAATLSGGMLGSIQDIVCRPHVESGKLIEVYKEVERVTWPIYAFRPRQTVTPLRVRKVFDLLVESLRARLPAENR